MDSDYFTLILSASILLWGRVADKVGRLKVYTWGLGLFAISSLLCGASISVGMLIICRAIQGLSAAMMQATGIALITTRLEGEAKSKAMGIFGMFIGLGPMMGPVVGGLILSSVGWRWLFWINLPICILGLYGCSRLAPVQESLKASSFNYKNLALLTVTLFSLMLTLNWSSHGHHPVLVLAGVTVVLALVYLICETTTKKPVIPLKYFLSISFLAPILGIIAFGGATSVSFMLPPLYFEKLRHFSSWQVGLISLSAPLGILISARSASKVIQKIGTQKAMLIGMGLMIVALLTLTQWQTSWPVYVIFGLLLLYGLGGGLFQTPCYINITSQFVPSEQAFISALVRMVQNLAIAFESAGAALLISLAQQSSSSSLLQGLQHGWWLAGIMAIVALIALVVSYWQRGGYETG